MTALDASPWQPHGSVDPVCGPTEPPESWPTTGIGLVCLAAWARIKLDDGEVLSPRELAALGGLPGPNSLRALVSRSKLTARARGEIAAREARRWLSGRGVRV